MKTNETGYDVLERLEDHCGEKIECSSRVRFQITATFSRLLEADKKLRKNIESILNGDSTFNPSIQKTISLSKRELGE